MAGEQQNIRPMAVKAPHVLTADDDPGMRKILGSLLESLGAKASCAADGEEAVAIFEAAKANGQEPNLVLLDVRMPKMDGTKTAQTLRQKGFTGPILAFTGVVSLTNKKECEAAGITRYFSKGVLKKDLVGALLQQYCNWGPITK
jgi:two-component system, NarL family, capsular synthesis sensor histidine kinase RcsC